jgi:hypothetical protein
MGLEVGAEQTQAELEQRPYLHGKKGQKDRREEGRKGGRERTEGKTVGQKGAVTQRQGNENDEKKQKRYVQKHTHTPVTMAQSTVNRKKESHTKHTRVPVVWASV